MAEASALGMQMAIYCLLGLAWKQSSNTSTTLQPKALRSSTSFVPFECDLALPQTLRYPCPVISKPEP
jgi:hypothetical protein